MQTFPLTELFDRPSKLGFDVRVRGTTYLWGSDTITANMSFESPPLLHIRNFIYGNDVSFGTTDASGQSTVLGSLKTGQCVTIKIQNIIGVFVECGANLETVVGCVINS